MGVVGFLLKRSGNHIALPDLVVLDISFFPLTLRKWFIQTPSLTPIWARNIGMKVLRIIER